MDCYTYPINTPAAAGLVASELALDGHERVVIALILSPDLSDEERALTIDEGLSVAKALLSQDTVH